MRFLKRLLPRRADAFWILLSLLFIGIALALQVVPLKLQPLTVFLFLLPLMILLPSILLGLGVISTWSCARRTQWGVLFFGCILGILVLPTCLYDVRSSGRRETLADFFPFEAWQKVRPIFDLSYWGIAGLFGCCLLYTSPSPRDKRQSRMPSSA